MPANFPISLLEKKLRERLDAPITVLADEDYETMKQSLPSSEDYLGQMRQTIDEARAANQEAGPLAGYAPGTKTLAARELDQQRELNLLPYQALTASQKANLEMDQQKLDREYSDLTAYQSATLQRDKEKEDREYSEIPALQQAQLGLEREKYEREYSEMTPYQRATIAIQAANAARGGGGSGGGGGGGGGSINAAGQRVEDRKQLYQDSNRTLTGAYAAGGMEAVGKYIQEKVASDPSSWSGYQDLYNKAIGNGQGGLGFGLIEETLANSPNTNPETLKELRQIYHTTGTNAARNTLKNVIAPSIYSTPDNVEYMTQSDLDAIVEQLWRQVGMTPAAEANKYVEAQ